MQRRREIIQFRQRRKHFSNLLLIVASRQFRLRKSAPCLLQCGCQRVQARLFHFGNQSFRMYSHRRMKYLPVNLPSIIHPKQAIRWRQRVR